MKKFGFDIISPSLVDSARNLGFFALGCDKVGVLDFSCVTIDRKKVTDSLCKEYDFVNCSALSYNDIMFASIDKRIDFFKPDFRSFRLDDKACSLLVKNEQGVEVCVKDFFGSGPRTFSNLVFSLLSCKKKGVFVWFTTRAKTDMELRDSLSLVSVGASLGLGNDFARLGCSKFPKKVLERKALIRKSVCKGVIIEE